MIIVKAGSTSVTIPLFIQDSTSTTGAGKTGLAYNTSGWKVYYVKPGSTPVAITLVTQTATGSWTSGGFCEIDATTMPGYYRLDLPNAAVSTNSGAVIAVSLSGATGAAPCNVGVNMVAYDPANSANLGLSNLATYTLTNIIDRLPASLVSGRMDASVGAYATGQDPATLVLATPAQKLVTDASGRVTVGTIAAAAVASIWDALTSGITTAGSIGKRIVDYLTGDAFTRLGAPAGASVSADIVAVKTETATIKAKTDNLPASPAAVGSAMTLADGAITAAKIATDAIDADAIASDAITEIQSGLSTLNAAGVRAAVGLASANLDTQLDTLPTAAEIATAVQSGTSLADLALMVEADGTPGAKFTTTALENAPSGGGGGGGGTIVIERQIRLSVDTASPIAEPFAFMQGDAYTLKAYITDYNGDPINLTGYTLTASATNAFGTEIDAPTVTAYDEVMGIVDIAITSDLTGDALTKGYLSVKMVDGDTYVTVPTEISVGAR